MIRIEKPSEPPPVLRERGMGPTAELCRSLDAGERVDVTFDRSIYGSPEVKEALRTAQHDKCCFCESKITHVSFGDVEHFRPKAAVRQSPEASLHKPGYYWLAYEWSNLYLACEQCNRRHKQNLFPLLHDSERARSHRDLEAVQKERPLFIDPGREDPADHIRFRRAFAGPVSESKRGATTIENLGLNRDALRARRQERRESLLGCLKLLRLWLAYGSSEGFRPDAEHAARLVLDSMRKESEFCAMARAVVRDAMPWRREDLPGSPARLLEALEFHAERGQVLAIPPR